MNTKTNAAKTNNAAAPAADKSAETVNNATAFWAQLATHATPIAKLTGAQSTQDPKLAMRTRFEKAVSEQIKRVESAADKSRWFKKLSDGSYELTVRNGNSAMSLGGNCFFQAKDVASAVQFYEQIAAGTKVGELDAVLQAAQRKPRTKKTATPAPSPAPAGDAQKQ